MYNYKKIESKWQKYWEDNDTFKVVNGGEKEKYYILVEFPYPSGSGLHVGHVRSYAALDAMARYKRMKGYNVLYPMGWDAFGAPAEQYAIKNKIHPKEAVLENIKTFKNQIKSLGISFDWSREFSTTDPNYYKWTQWQFLKFYEKGMAYKAEAEINWCPSCLTGLSNEDSSGGVCERCGTKVTKKLKSQWILRMSDYADKLLEGLDKTEFVQRVKTAQINWIGKSVGAEINFKVKGVNDVLKVFTTRPDTLYGVTFMVMSPEHKFLEKYKDMITNCDEIREYQKYASSKTEIERTDMSKEKTGVMVCGVMAINPVTNEEIPIWISDYILANYGTGAIMAVPAHDERDYDYAKKYNLEIKPVIEKIDDNESSIELPFVGEGKVINSPLINGITSKEEAINKMICYLEKEGIGVRKTNYRLQDWIFSRQRFWGEPIPMIYCETCGWVPVPESDLPVVLPDVTHYEPTETGESPLASIDTFLHVACPKCGKMAKRETDTMPNWAGSSWYYLRYMDPHNNDCFASKDAMKYWGMVDYYNGGMEHATRHLLYARFWNEFLYDEGLVVNPEPFKKRVAHGMILGDNGEKMSKSKGNVVNPNDMVNEYGADALRCYEMFIGDYEKDASWSENGLKGCKKFLDRVYRIKDKVVAGDCYTKSLEKLIHKTIKKVSYDLENMGYNTLVSALMILTNAYDKMDVITKADYRILLHLLNPIAPHITEELNEICQLGDKFTDSVWPEYDEAKLEDDMKEIGVQVNGKLRGTILINNSNSEDIIKEKALSDDNVKRHLCNKEIVRFIIIPNRIVNIIVKEIN